MKYVKNSQFSNDEGQFSNDEGQTTAEYALVLLGAVAIAGLMLAWAGKTSVITDLMNAVFSKIANLVK